LQRYRSDIDGLRALAILPVILFHAELGCTGGFVGVDVFYVISGYLICSLILRDRAYGRFSLAAFWERRIRRILPALAVVAFVTLAAGWFVLLPDDFLMLGKSVVAQATLLSNVFFYQTGKVGGGYFDPVPNPKPLLHTWSLAVEEQFYFLFPLLLIFLTRYHWHGRIRILGALAIGSFALSVYGSFAHPLATFYLMPTRAWELALGVLLAMLRRRLLAGQWLREASGWAGICLMGLAAFGYTPNTRFPGLAAVPPCLGAALVIWSSESRTSLAGRLLAFKPVVFIGLISYSLYLWHWPLLVLAKYMARGELSVMARAGLLVASVGLAALTWKYVETPIRRRRLLPTREQAFGLAGVATAAMLMLGLLVIHQRGFPSRLPENALQFVQARRHSAFLNEITLEQALAGRFAELGPKATNRPIQILIWGDSHAMAVTPVLDDLCREHSWRGMEATHSATAPILGFFTLERYGLNERSLQFNDAVLDFIRSNHIRNVVMAGAWPSYYTASKTFGEQLCGTIQRIIDAGARVYVLKDVPHPGEAFDVPRVAALCARYKGDLERLGLKRDQYELENRQLDPIFEQISQLGATVLDPSDYFLNRKNIYGVVKDNQLLYRDFHHLTVEGARMLTPLFEPIFAAN